MPARQPPARTENMPLRAGARPPPVSSSTGGGLGERQPNAHSPPHSSINKTKNIRPVSQLFKDTSTAAAPNPSSAFDRAPSHKRSKSSSHLHAVFAKLNRSTKDIPAATMRFKDKENTTPPSSYYGGIETPIWAQHATTFTKPSFTPAYHDAPTAINVIADEIARYTPREYSAGRQRNFSGLMDDEPGLRSRPGTRPSTSHRLGSDGLMGAIGRRVSSAKSSMESRRSAEVKETAEPRGRISVERTNFLRRSETNRKTSGSSAEQAPAKEKLNIAKRGARVMAAVAAFQGKTKDAPAAKAEAPLDPRAVDEAFEAVLDSRNVPEPQRQKMRALTIRVKADFIRQNQEASRNNITSTSASRHDYDVSLSSAMVSDTTSNPQSTAPTEDSKSTKRTRGRSRTFTFSKGDKKVDNSSPAKKQRSRSKTRPLSIQIPRDSSASILSPSPMTPTGRKGAAAAAAFPADYINYLRQHTDPTQTEVGRLHKLRILLRNETVAWVSNFVSMGGMAEIVGLLNRIMAIEWREEHEDQLLHETLLCLKGLCTTERAIVELDKFADQLFPALLGMLFDNEKKGPAEYTTRTIIMNVLFSFLASAIGSDPQELELRARRILTYLGEPPQPEDVRPLGFVLEMQTPRPYKLWSREVSNVTKEVFWIFLHQRNIIPLPEGYSGSEHSTVRSPQRYTDSTPYSRRHFPGARPPIPAAPYIGGVEWDATTYLAAHIDLLNGLIASLASHAERVELRSELCASGFEKTMGQVLRTCKEKFYSCVHDGLRAWVAAALDDGWDVRYVREGPSDDERGDQALRARSASPRKARKNDDEKPPQLDIQPPPQLKLQLLDSGPQKATHFPMTADHEDQDGWIG